MLQIFSRLHLVNLSWILLWNTGPWRSNTVCVNDHIYQLKPVYSNKIKCWIYPLGCMIKKCYHNPIAVRYFIHAPWIVIFITIIAAYGNNSYLYCQIWPRIKRCSLVLRFITMYFLQLPCTLKFRGTERTANTYHMPICGFLVLRYVIWRRLLISINKFHLLGRLSQVLLHSRPHPF